MIKFFRKIRQNLLSEGKTGKYFKYAIGEIILVVIGILIALGINNWNENRKNKNLESLYIQELTTDLIKDSIIIDKLLNQSNKQLRAKFLLQKYLTEQTDFVLYDNNSFKSYPNYLKSETYDLDSLASYYQIQWTSKSRYPFTPIKTTIDEMKSTGKIGIIQNLDLRRSIIETYNNYDSYRINYNDNYKPQADKVLELIFDDKPELYTMDNSSVIRLFQDPRVRNRFEGNFVISINYELKKLKEVNENLLKELNEYSKRK
jgi:hypothetical protein